jgi:hypothetical protein
MEKVDWVSKFAACNISSAFEQLKLDVSWDVTVRNEQLRKIPSNYTFEFLGNGASFVVATNGNGIAGRAVKFILADAVIAVIGPKDEKLFDAALTLSDDGVCRFLIDGAEKESWQLRKRALEKLLFTSPWERP